MTKRQDYASRVSRALDELETTNAGGDSYRALINAGWCYNTGVKPAVLPFNIDMLNVLGDHHTCVGVGMLDWNGADEYAIAFWRPSVNSEISINKDVTDDTLSKMTGQNDVMKQQVGGSHYKRHKIQPWHIVEEYDLCFWLGNAIKYILRDKNDNQLEDLKKARHYLDKKISMLEDGK